MPTLLELEKRAPVVTQKVADLLEANADYLGLKGVWYGDQELLPDFPCAVVESFTKQRDYATIRQYDITFRVGILVYVGEIQSSQITKKQSEELAEAVEDLMHENRTLDGMVIHGYVSSMNPGVASRAGKMVRAVRLIFTAKSREYLK